MFTYAFLFLKIRHLLLISLSMSYLLEVYVAAWYSQIILNMCAAKDAELLNSKECLYRF